MPRLFWGDTRTPSSALPVRAWAALEGKLPGASPQQRSERAFERLLPFSRGKMPYCKKDVVVISLQNHEENVCSGYPVSCPNKCLQIIPRTEVDEPLAMCPEAERDCPFKGWVCTPKDKRGNLQDHERSALRDHRLLVSFRKELPTRGKDF